MQWQLISGARPCPPGYEEPTLQECAAFARARGARYVPFAPWLPTNASRTYSGCVRGTWGLDDEVWASVAWQRATLGCGAERTCACARRPSPPPPPRRPAPSPPLVDTLVGANMGSTGGVSVTAWAAIAAATGFAGLLVALGCVARRRLRRRTPARTYGAAA